MPLKAVALNATLKASPAPSSTDKLIRQLADEMPGVETEFVRLVDHDIKTGVTSDEGGGDAWPAIRAKILAADILIFGTPIWLGQPCSVAKRILERMDAFLSETDDEGRMPSFGKVACLAIVGNEDGAHHVTAELYQALSDVGFSIPASGSVYWVGQAMQKTDYRELKDTPEEVAAALTMTARTTVHLATLLKDNPIRR